MIHLKRVYEPPSTNDGFRILVERLWPRGLSKSRAQVDLWLKDIAPSPQLRTWYGHELAKWQEFKRRYRAELQNNSAVGQLQQLQHDKPIITRKKEVEHDRHSRGYASRLHPRI